MTRAGVTVVTVLFVLAQTPRQAELLSQIEDLVRELRQDLSVGTVSNGAELRTALEAGGRVRLQPGEYIGNFTIARATTLEGSGEVVLAPADQFTPTLVVRGSDVTVRGITIRNGAPDRDTVVVGSNTATTVQAQPRHVLFEDVQVVAGPRGGHRGFALHGADVTLRRVRVENFFERGRESQAVWINNGPGPFTIEDSYLEASGENILVGGDHIRIPNLVPSDIVIRRNVLHKPDTWRGAVVVKNLLELKIGRRVLIEDNRLEGNWAGGQDGSSILFTVRNQYGTCNWCTIDEVTLRGNTLRRATDGYAVSILAADSNYPSGRIQTLTIEQNLFQDAHGGIRLGGRIGQRLTIDHNTLPSITKTFLSFYGSGQTPLAFTANVVRSGAYGIHGTGRSPGIDTLNAYTDLIAFSGNVIERSAARNIPYPPENRLLQPGGLAAALDARTFALLDGSAGHGR